jgi:hypothetical protein
MPTPLAKAAAARYQTPDTQKELVPHVFIAFNTPLCHFNL